MAYTINRTNGTILATVADGTIDTTSCSVTLVGKNYAGYGEFLDENYVHILENSANTTPPGVPMTGQLWWDSGNSLLKVYNGTTFKTISAATASATAPTSNVQGDLWYDTNNAQLKVYTGTQFILVGPASSSGQGTSGAIVDTVQDTGLVNHVVIKLYCNNTVVGIVSKDATFTPASPGITGFGTISPGIQLSSTVSGALFTGTATDSNAVGGISSANLLVNNANQTTSGTFGVANDTGLTVGADADLKMSVTGVTSVNIQNQTQNSNINMIVNDGGVNTTPLQIIGSTSEVGVLGLVNLNSNGVGNLGSASSYFNTVFATATTALYADVAERFHADEVLAPGTVVELGGVAEITKSIEELSDNVFGVVSTRAAYLMNSGAGTDETHPPVAMTGRVPVRVIGAVKKGDRLVSAGQGLARAALPGEATAFNTIGRALETREATDEGMVEAIVTIK